jgi:hypothetical protein
LGAAAREKEWERGREVGRVGRRTCVRKREETLQSGGDFRLGLVLGLVAGLLSATFHNVLFLK